MRSSVPRGAVIFDDMNSVVLTCCALFVLAVLPAQAGRGVLATAAASLFEGTAFILAGTLLQVLVARVPRLHRMTATSLAFLGCGCGTGASGRSLPAAASTALTFGPAVALARLAAALVVPRLCHPERQRAKSRDRHDDSVSPLNQLASLLPAALLGGFVLHAFGELRIESIHPVLQWLAGALFGFAAAPCALGAVALAASLHVRAPLAAIGLLSTSGIVDLHTFAHARHADIRHDALAYAIASTALSIVAMHGGGALVHPRFVLPLALCAIACAALALVHRRASCSRARIAPALMLAGALISAPPPVYTATETTLADAFPGEHLMFTGQLVHGKSADAVVRYAITCCRADAAPVVIRLAQPLRYAAGTWLRVDGVIVRAGEELRLEAQRVQAIAPPADPFVYR